MDIATFAEKAGAHQATETSYFGCCPVCADREYKLAICQCDGFIHLHCHNGCNPISIAYAIGVNVSDLVQRRDFWGRHLMRALSHLGRQGGVRLNQQDKHSEQQAFIKSAEAA